MTGIRYTALSRRWAGSWEVYILDSIDGLLGQVQASTLAEVDLAVREFLRGRPAGLVEVIVVE